MVKNNSSLEGILMVIFLANTSSLEMSLGVFWLRRGAIQLLIIELNQVHTAGFIPGNKTVRIRRNGLRKTTTVSDYG